MRLVLFSTFFFYTVQLLYLTEGLKENPINEPEDEPPAATFILCDLHLLTLGVKLGDHHGSLIYSKNSVDHHDTEYGLETEFEFSIIKGTYAVPQVNGAKLHNTTCAITSYETRNYGSKNSRQRPIDLGQYVACPSGNKVLIDPILARSSMYNIVCFASHPLQFNWLYKNESMEADDRPFSIRSWREFDGSPSVGPFVMKFDSRGLNGKQSVDEIVGDFFVWNEQDSSMSLNWSLQLNNVTAVMTQPTLPNFDLNQNVKPQITLLSLLTASCLAPNRSKIIFENYPGRSFYEARTLFAQCSLHNDSYRIDKMRTCGDVVRREDRSLDGVPFISFIRPLHQSGVLSCRTNSADSTTVRYYTDMALNQHEYPIEEGTNPVILMARPNDNRSHVSFFEHKDMLLSKFNSTADFFDRKEVDFECKIVSYVLQSPVIWTVTYQNGAQNVCQQDDFSAMKTETVQLDLIVDELNKTTRRIKYTFLTSYLRIAVSRDMVSLTCQAHYKDKGKVSQYIGDELQLQIKESHKPSFGLWADTPTPVYEKVGSDFNLTCVLKEAQPNATITWSKKGETLENNRNGITMTSDPKDDRISILQFSNSVSSHSGEYTCTAENFLGKAEQQFTVNVSEENYNWIYMVSIGVTALLVVVSVGVSFVGCWQQRAKLSSIEASFRSGHQGAHTLLTKHSTALEHTLALSQLPYHDEFEVSFVDFVLENKILGQGAFGKVVKAMVRDTPAAAKTIHPGAETADLDALLSELKIMIHLGSNENIIQLVGAYTAALKAGHAIIFTELCEMGSLEKFLMDNRHLYLTPISESTSSFTSVTGLEENVELQPLEPRLHYVAAMETISSSSSMATTSQVQLSKGRLDLVIWSSQIANGMEFLENKRVVHADLATRNVLLKSIHEVKITDFGLSRQLYSKPVTSKKVNGRLPWPWMAPESICDRRFSNKSDVWSYGVTTWEIFSLGGVPYSGLTMKTALINLKNGRLRLSKPTNTSDEIYVVMEKCWAKDPHDRPSFAYVKQFFQSQLTMANV